MGTYWIVEYKGDGAEGYFNIYVNEGVCEYNVARAHIDTLIRLGRIPDSSDLWGLTHVRVV